MQRLLKTGYLFVALMLCGVGANEYGAAQNAPPKEATLEWPNAESKATSDEWIRLHHNEIKVMRPQTLVLNFVNGLSSDEAQKRAEAVIGAIREASRYHGYKKKSTPAFLEYRIFRVVDMTDEVLPPDDQRLDGNSSFYPRVVDWKPGMSNFRYADLFSEKFTEKYKVADPDNASHLLSLGEMLGKGLVHEVWVLALENNLGAPVRCAEIKQGYDATLRKIGGKAVQTGTAPAEDLPFPGRSLRVLHLNTDKGSGCALESLGYALEALARSKAIPYFTRYFNEFAGFDLKTRYRTSFNSFYEREGGTELTYPEPNTLIYTRKGEKFRVPNYVAVGGSVHFAPSSRRDFDIFNNPTPVLSTIENYRLRNGLDGKDKAENWTLAKIERYRQTAPDCSGAWMVYWRQSMPGLDTRAVDDDGKPMRNWWPFLFY